jgi:hypothetical protein
MLINAQCTIRSTDSKMYTLSVEPSLYSEKKIMRVAVISWGPTGRSMDILRKAKEDNLD